MNDKRRCGNCKKTLEHLWGKAGKNNLASWHPLILHQLDVAAAADAILAREPEKTRKKMGEILGMTWKDARSWLMLIIACHDLGKACPGFQSKWTAQLASSGLPLPPLPNQSINHAIVSQIALTALLQETGWPPVLAELVADAIGCHHGKRATGRAMDDAALEIYIGQGERLEAVRNAWIGVRHALFESLLDAFEPDRTPDKESLSGSDFMLLSGLTSFADWIGSNEDWFPYGKPDECRDLKGWFEKRTGNAERAMNAIGWEHRMPLSEKPRSFEQVFALSPRPLQKAVADCLAHVHEPSVLLVEAPMGEGKTEAAFYTYLELQRRFGHRGLYIALPTRATGSAMYRRTLGFLRSLGTNRRLDMQLVQGGAIADETFQQLRIAGISDEASGGEIRAGEWFTHKKRALLSEYGVGTVDQAIMPILPVRHHFVRLWGLANRVVVFDEIHAYDAYTGSLLIQLLRWLLALGSSVVLLSATLPSSVRQRLAAAVNALLESDEQYPRLTVYCSGGNVVQKHFKADPARRRCVRILGTAPGLADMQSAMEEHLPTGMGLALVNTVQRAQDFYRLFPDGEPLERKGQRVGKRLPNGTEVYLFHARFSADRRQHREELVLEVFGEEGKGRSGRKILIATQVAEQSLDLDFDLIASDLAPIDLLLQRAGRLWRHERGARPVPEPILIIAGLACEEPPQFGKPLWWGSVYSEALLLYTWILLKNRKALILPDEIDSLVQAVYEEQVEVPEFLRRRLNGAQIVRDGDEAALRQMANQAIVGLPDDESWNQPDVFVLFDEDEPGVHRDLIAKTRQGRDAVMAIPLWRDDSYHGDKTPDFDQARTLFLQTVILSHPSVVRKLTSTGVPEGWRKSTLLRNCIPMLLDTEGVWILDEKVRMDENLGIVYEF